MHSGWRLAAMAVKINVMTDAILAKELRVISRKLDEVLADERTVALESERRQAEAKAAIENLLQAVQESKATGRWRNTRLNVFEVLGYCRLE